MIPPPMMMELPPRARRIPGHLFPTENHIGTTSACAENTAKPGKKGCSQRNYLRVRGEYAQVLQPDILAMELPPRARRIR